MYLDQKRWFTKFRNGDFSMEDELRSGDSTIVDGDFLKRKLKEDPKFNSSDVATHRNT
jgi:hypothetical protein